MFFLLTISFDIGHVKKLLNLLMSTPDNLIRFGLVWGSVISGNCQAPHLSVLWQTVQYVMKASSNPGTNRCSWHLSSVIPALAATPQLSTIKISIYGLWPLVSIITSCWTISLAESGVEGSTARSNQNACLE